MTRLLASPVAAMSGGTLVLCLLTMAALSFMAIYSLQRVSPKLQMAAQAAGWQEARLAAESGIDIAIAELNRNATGVVPGKWDGWKQSRGGIIGPAVAATLDQVNSLLSLLGGGITVSEPIFLDNLKVSPPGGHPAEVDVQLWAVQPTANPYHRWYRIRSMATCELPTPLAVAPESLEAPLRRYSLRKIRPQLRADDVGMAMTVRTPSVSRIVEVLVEPVLPFELAIFTERSLRLGTSGNWNVDSFDSRDSSKSGSGGVYPGRASPLVQANGNIASNRGRPGDALFGPLIEAQGARVAGGVATNGGDDPATRENENIAGAGGIDPDRVRDDFFREMPLPARPSSGIVLPPPLLGLPYLAGPETAPTKYIVTRNLGAFAVAAPPIGERGAVIIMVDGDFDVNGRDLHIPPNVTVQIYVRGNIDFRANAINSGEGSSRRAAQLQIYGEDSGGEPRTLRAHGRASICAAFYGPHYNVRLMDEVEWCGAVAARSFEMLGGGQGGVHYDEALGLVGAPIGFRIARYVEDVRK